MTDHPEIPYLNEVMVFLVAAGFIIPAVQKIGISSALGFLFFGIVIGPFGLGQFVAELPALDYIVIADTEGVRRFAELGIIFLLFTIGLELSFSKLWVMRSMVFGFGAIQVVVTSLVIGVIAYAFGNTLVAATILGLALSLSSTALVMQLLTENRQLSSAVGTSSFAVLLFQDLAVVPILFFVGVVGAGVEGPLLFAAIEAFGVAVVVIALIFFAGRLLVRPFLRFVGSAGSREVFMAAAILLVLITAKLTAMAGLSMALGAFLAGLLFAGTEYRHQIASDIEPFKGLLLGLFFVSIGMSFNILAIWDNIGWVVISAAGLLGIKAIVLFTVARWFKIPKQVAAETSILLSQGGEFAFVILAVALSFSLIDSDIAQFMLLVVILTMFFTPMLATISRAVGQKTKTPDAVPHHTRPQVTVERRVIIGGYGRVGKMLAQFLEEQRVLYVAIDSDAELVARERANGAAVFFGDASQSDLLTQVGIEHAIAFATTMDKHESAEKVVAQISKNWPQVPIFARARDIRHAKKLRANGAKTAIPETVEATLEMCEQLLSSLGFPDEAARAFIDKKRNWHFEDDESETNE